ncbi:MAG TPA: ribonuclease HI family protein [Thermoanaerobaculaceae bacterium]|nr:ribonuclease HI family protein [Thermoanaerobaculaceae bacterium]
MSPGLHAAAAVDGGSRGNPGDAGCGIVLEVAGRRELHTLYLGTATNNVAEYAALLAALERARSLGVETLAVKSDSELLVRQMKGTYKVKAAHLKPLWLRARVLAAGFRRFGISHVAREANRTADQLANRAMDDHVSTLPRPEGV